MDVAPQYRLLRQLPRLSPMAKTSPLSPVLRQLPCPEESVTWLPLEIAILMCYLASWHPMVWSLFATNRKCPSTACSALAGARRAHGAPPGGRVQADCRACFGADALDLRHEGLLLCISPYPTLPYPSVPHLSQAWRSHMWHCPHQQDQ